MLQKEFEERVGKTVSVQDYEFANKVYMATNLDKDEFCKMWVKATPAIGLIQELVGTVIDLERAAKQCMERERLMNEKIDEYGYFIARQAYEGQSLELRDKAIEILGERKYIKYIVKTICGHEELMNEDCELLLKCLED